MSVDYLCSILEDVKHSITLDSDECLAIIAALKAGQAMRDGWIKDDYEKLDIATGKWDAATKEEL